MRPQIARSLRTLGRRANSSNAADKARAAAKDVAENPQVKKAVDSANQAWQQSTQAVQRFAGPIGDKAGNLLGSYRQPLVYNFNVFTSLCRQVYQAERLAPPTQLAQWASAYSQIFACATSPAWWSKAMSNGQLAKVAVAGVEAYGLYKIGEIIGRRHLIGYKVDAPAHH